MIRRRAGGRAGHAVARALVLVALASAWALGGGAANATAAGPSAGLPASAPGVRAAIGDAPVLAAAAASGTSTVAAQLTPAEQRRADELRRVVRDALEQDGEDGSGLGDLDVGGVGGVLWRLGAVVVVLLGVVVVIALVRRGPRARRRAAAAAVAAGDPAGELERQALRAEEAGEHRAAVVLWFRAGTRGLLERRRIRAAAATATAGQVARASGDDRVAALAVAHDRAAYGPGPVGAEASRGAREGWAGVLREQAAAPGPRSAGWPDVADAQPGGTVPTSDPDDAATDRRREPS